MNFFNFCNSEGNKREYFPNNKVENSLILLFCDNFNFLNSNGLLIKDNLKYYL